MYITGTFPKSNNTQSGIFIYHRINSIKDRISYTVSCPYVVYNVKKKNYVDKNFVLNDVVFNYDYVYLSLFDKFKNTKVDIYKKILKVIESKYSLNDFDLIHTHGPFPYGYVAMLLSKKYNIPYVITSHGSDIHTYPFKDDKIKELTVEALNNADKCIFVSNKLKNIATEIGYNNKNFEIIPNGFDKNLFYYTNSKSKEKKIVGFVGNLIDVKNADKLVDIFNEVYKNDKNTEFIIIGEGQYKKFLEEKASLYNLPINITGRLSQKEVAKYMNKMNIMILPSKNEGFGAVIIEAQACGVYVIGSNRGGIPEAIGEYGSVIEYNENSLISDFSKEILNINLSEVKVDKILKRILNFEWSILSSKLYNIYNDIYKRKY